MEDNTVQLAEINFKLRKLEAEEQKLLFDKHFLSRSTKEMAAGGISKLQSKIPDKLEETLRKAMKGAFRTVFDNGRYFIDKTYSDKTLRDEYADKRFFAQTGRKRSREGRVSRSQRRYAGEVGFTTVKGVGLGIVGIGLPDVPVLIAELIRICSVSAKSHGFCVERQDEQVYMLRLIRLAAASVDERMILSAELDSLSDIIDKGETAGCHIDEEIDKTADTLTIAMLVSRFVMGVSIVGVAGGLYDTVIVSRMHRLAEIEYEKRLQQKCKADILRQLHQEPNV